MIEKVLSISGKPGLFVLVSRGNRSLIVETLDAQKKRMPIFGTDKVISLADVAMYTDSEDVPLRQVLQSMFEKENGQKVALDARSASREELAEYLASVLPDFDRERVYPTDMKKLILWYNTLIENNITDFKEEEAEATQEA